MPGCTELTDSGRCVVHAAKAERVRGNSTQRGYGSRHETSFRAEVLRRTPWCLCGKRANVADHYPRTRRQLVALGLDPNDPQYGRGLCESCHNRHTGLTSPGGAVANQL